MKKITKIPNNTISSIKANIYWTIIIIGVLTVALLLAGCGLQNGGWQNLFSDVGPAWSPDGSKIAFGVAYAQNSDIWVMNADGSNQINLTNKPGLYWGNAWSPNGSKIAFGLGPVNEIDIWVMNSDGSNKINLTGKPGNYWEPTWSPDAGKISFVSAGAEEKFDIWVMNADGSNQINLTGN